MKFFYGDSWEKYPIEEGEIWAEKASGSKVSVCDITKGLPDYMFDADMIYCDPPWSLGNANSFITKAGKTEHIHAFSDFYACLFSYILNVKAKSCYVEIGKQYRTVFEREMRQIYPSVLMWEITYYKKNPCFLIRGGRHACHGVDFDGRDDAETPHIAISMEGPESVSDPCTGQGLTAIAAYKLGKRFLGTELNKRRLAVAIDKANRIGAQYEKSSIY